MCIRDSYYEEVEFFRNRYRGGCDQVINHKLVHEVGASADEDWRTYQNRLSEYLFWYKMGTIPFLIFFTGSFLNSWLNLFLSPAMRGANGRVVRKKSIMDLKLIFSKTPAILNYGRKHSSKEFGLKWR